MSNLWIVEKLAEIRGLHMHKVASLCGLDWETFYRNLLANDHIDGLDGALGISEGFWYDLRRGFLSGTHEEIYNNLWKIYKAEEEVRRVTV